MKAAKGFPAREGKNLQITNTGTRFNNRTKLKKKILIIHSTVALPVLHPGISTMLAELTSPCSCSSVLDITITARGGLTQCGFTCIVDCSLRKSQLENAQLCAAAAWSNSSCLVASAKERSQGQLQVSCWLSLCHPHPAKGRLCRHQEHLWVGKAHSPTQG